MQQFSIGDVSAVAPARRGVSALAAGLGFAEEDAGRAALVATEIGTNLIKHGGGGTLIAKRLTADNRNGIELLGLDKGPGIVDIGQSLRDGFSTSGSPGTGLGAIERMSEYFELYSRPGLGTAVLAQLWPQAKPPGPQRFEMGSVLIPAPNETMCGDAWCHSERVEGLLLIGVDGLGHGYGASQAATEACRVFEAEKHRPAQRLIQIMHEALRPTRGAAVTLLEADWDAGKLTSVSVGNVQGAVITGNQIKRIAADNGIVGHVISRPRELVHDLARDSIIVVHSDGLTANWQPERYPGLMQHHPALIAGVLYRDCNRGRDDSLVVVVRRAAS